MTVALAATLASGAIWIRNLEGKERGMAEAADGMPVGLTQVHAYAVARSDFNGGLAAAESGRCMAELTNFYVIF